ncbi:MAG: MarR family transcriptional regulator [Blautia sp.]|nr:MarR family transcriptional regulator [Blautia sp.]
MDNLEHSAGLEDLTQQLMINQLRYSKQISQLTQFLNASGEYSILYILYHEPEAHCAGEFASRLDLTPGRVANVLKALEKKNLIERKKDPADGRRIMVTLTASGREYITRTYSQAAEVYHDLIEEIGEDDTREFLRITRKILEASKMLRCI